MPLPFCPLTLIVPRASQVVFQGGPGGFRRRFRARRRELGLTQEKLAVHLQVTRNAVWFWEKGLRVPRASTLRRLAEFLSETPRDLA